MIILKTSWPDMSRFFILLVLSILLCPVLSAQDSQELDTIDVCSAIDAVLVNANAIISADCLVRERLTFDSTNDTENNDIEGTLLRKTSFTRAIFDEDKNQFAYYSNSVGFRTLLPDFEEFGNTDFSAWCCDARNGKIARLGGTNYIDSNQDLSNPGKLQELLAWERFPDYRGFWLYRGPSVFGRIRKDDSLKSMRHGKYFHSSQRHGGKLDVYFESGVKVLNDSDEFLKVYTFDMEQLVVTKIRAVLVGEGKWQNVATFEIEWDEINDIMVPISGSLEKFQNMYVDANTKQAGKICQEFDFHWFKINEEIDPELFAVENVKDQKAVLNMIDPVKLNAATLIDDNFLPSK